MAQLRRYAPKPRLQRDLERLTIGIAALRRVHNLIHGVPMPGEIRNALAEFRAAHARMTSNIVAEMKKATAACPQIEQEGIAAAKLPAAMNDAIRGEIRELTAEFATQTNGGPDGPLPGSEPSSQAPSANSAPQGSDQKVAPEPHASWQGDKT